MSRNSKQARLVRERKTRKNGAAQTTPKHGKKVRAWANRKGTERPSLHYTPGMGWQA